MEKIKLQKGITLVALIITIVVLLILTVVTIRTISADGVIVQVQGAAKKYEASQEQEEIALLQDEWVLNKYDNSEQTFKEFIKSKLLDTGKAISVKGADNGPLIVQMKSTNIYTVEEHSVVALNPVTDELEKYILGEDKKGRELSEIISSNAFIKDSNISNSTIHTKLKLAYKENTNYYFRYNRDVYKFEVSTETPVKTLKGTLTLVNIPEGNLGKYVRYKGIDWIVLREDSKKVELISANTTGTYTIPSSLAKAREFYNNIESTLTDACEKATGITSNIRSVGGPSTTQEILSNENTVDFSEIETFHPTVSDANFAQYEGTTNGLRKEDSNYVSDYTQMKELGLLMPDVVKNSYYLISSRETHTIDTGVIFSARIIDEGSGVLETKQAVMISRAAKYYSGASFGEPLRSVITLETGILDGATQTGLRDNPIVLN